MSLQADLLRIAKKYDGALKDIADAAFLRLMNQVWQGSVVDTGRFRNNWNGAVTAPDLSANRNADRSASGSNAQVNETLNRYDLGQSLYFTNSVPYAWRLEYDGWSERMPNGVVRITARKWDSIVSDEVAKRR